MRSEHERVYQREYYLRNKAHIEARRVANKQHQMTYDKERYAMNKEQAKARVARYWRENKGRIKARKAQQHQVLLNQLYDMYGFKKEGHEHGVCTCCKEADLVMFGTLSHIDDSGCEHRKLTGKNQDRMLRDAIAVYNPSKFAAECYNCNLAVTRWGRETVRAYFDSMRAEKPDEERRAHMAIWASREAEAPKLEHGRNDYDAGDEGDEGDL